MELAYGRILNLAVAGLLLTSGPRVTLAMDPQTRSELKQARLTAEQRSRLENQTTMIVYVGNGEGLGTPEYLRSVSESDRKAALDRKAWNEARFFATVRKAGDDLRNALAFRNSVGPLRANGTVLLATILDGPRVNDSRITTVWYYRVGGRWTMTDEREWRYQSRGGLTPSNGAPSS